jgi:hypothetical protein
MGNEITLIDYARSNYILARLKIFLNLENEKNVTWHYDGSFNGAGLVNKQEAQLGTVWFDKKKSENIHDYLRQAKVADMWVIVDSSNEFEVESKLKEFNDDFENLLKVNEETILSQVGRFLLYVSFQDYGIKESVEKFISEITNEFENSECHKIISYFPPVEGLDLSLYTLFTFEIECILKKPVSKNDFIEKMEKFIPAIKEPIYGFGYLGQYGSNKNLPIHIHLYARQF